MASKTLLFHLLDTQARDIRIESETEDSKKIVYEPINADSDSEDSEGRKKRRFKRFDASQQMELMIHMFGTTADGKSIRVDVEGYRPTLYLELLEGKEGASMETLRAYMAGQGVPMSMVSLKKIMRKKFYGFTAGKLYPFLEITVPSLALMRTVKNLFLNGDSEPQTKKALGDPYKKGQRVAVYEANIDPMLRFFHVQNLNPCGWIQIKDGLEDASEEEGVLVVTANYADILPGNAPIVSAPFRLISWDIECYSRTGDFPVANKEWSKIGELMLKGCVYGSLVADRIRDLFPSGMIGQLRPKKTEAVLTKKLTGKSLQVPITTEETAESLGSVLRLALSDTISISDPVIQIGATVVTGVLTERHLFVWPSCEAIEGLVVHSYADEKAMIDGWFQWLIQINPDILIGYNVFGFDERYLWDRAEDLGCTASAQGLTRVPDSLVKCEEKRLSSSAMGDNFLYIWTALGRLQIDLFHYIKRNNASLPSYKLDEVTKYYLSGKLKKAERNKDRLALTLSGAVKDLRVGRALCLLEDTGESLTDKMVIEEIDASGVVFVNWPLREDGEVLEEEELSLANKWVVVKDDVSPADIFRLHCGTDADRAKVGKYCLQDCDLVLELYRKLEVFNNSMSMANVCCVPISYIFVRGQGIKAESLVFRACRERGTLIPVLGKPSQGPADSYEGAIVLDPVPGFYSKNPIGVADFASLYPSSIESENISHDSLVWTRDFDADGNMIAEVFASDVPESAIDRSKYGMTDIEFDLLRVDPEDKRKHPAKIKAGLRICRYAQPLDGSKATVPEIIRGLLATRKAKRKEAAKETDPMKKSLLEAEQSAYKLTGNSLYGQLGSGTFKVRLQHLAASITAYGRKQIMFAKEVIERFYGPGKHPTCVANVMYGDTDSLFIEFAVKDASGTPLTGREARQAVIDLTAEAGKLVSKALAPPHDFEFDKVFDPMLMFSKKRYAGFMFEENADDYVTKYMGIALKRRDNAPIVKTVYGTAMRKLLLDRDVPGATKYVQDACMDLVRGKVKLGQLTITKSLRAEYANPLQIAHKALADRMAARDPGNAPASGDRIPFIYVQPPVGSQAAKLQGDRVEAPSYIKEHGLVPDYEFYLGHQLQNPISQMFGLLLEEMPGSDVVPWSQKPEDVEKQLMWKEQMAAQILFAKAFQACNKHHTSAFVSRFFGPSVASSSIKNDSKELVAITATAATSVPAFMNHQIVKASEDKKPVQATLSSFMKYDFVVKNIQTIERKKRAAAKKELKAKEEPKSVKSVKALKDEKPKNEIILNI